MSSCKNVYNIKNADWKTEKQIFCSCFLFPQLFPISLPGGAHWDVRISSLLSSVLGSVPILGEGGHCLFFMIMWGACTEIPLYWRRCVELKPKMPK